MANANQRKTIEDAYMRLGVLNNIDWTAYRDQLMNLEKEYERKHRNFCHGRKYGLTVAQAAKYFTAKHIIDALNGQEYTVADYLKIKKSVFMAQSLVANYRDKIEATLQGFDYASFAELDYSTMVEA